MIAIQHRLVFCIVTNSPYMGSKGINKELRDSVKKRYSDSNSDLFAVFMKRILELTKDTDLWR